MAHVFISYVREDGDIVDKLCAELRENGLEIWLDREQIRPGQRWQLAIREAIQEGVLYIACFSRKYSEKVRTYMNEELTIAIEELRMRALDRIWFIPVKLSDCSIPNISVGGGESLCDIQWVDLSIDWAEGVDQILNVIEQAAEGLRGSLGHQFLGAMRFKEK